MSLKDIIVHIDDTRACDARLQFAARLARFHGAHLTGLYTIPPMVVPAYVAVEFPVEALQVQEETQLQRAREAQKRFEAVTLERGVDSEWRCQQGHFDSICAEHARYADLLILGQPETDDPEYNPENAPGEVILRSGRPVLLVPYIGAPETLCENVMVAWDGKRESIRAVADALPILRAAVSVSLVSVQDQGAASSEQLADSDIVRHLQRHGVDVQAQIINSAGLDIGNALIDHLVDSGSDLLVMGAWGHSRLREWVLGGTTRLLLNDMTVPVVMSH